MLTKTKATLIAALALLVALLMLCFPMNARLASEAEGVSVSLTADEEGKLSLIDERGKSDYLLVFSSDINPLDYELSQSIQWLFIERGIATVNIKSDSLQSRPLAHEILIGQTNRTESKDLLAQVEAACKNSDDLAWGYAVVGEKVLFLANSEVAFKYAEVLFIDYLVENSLVLASDLYVVGSMSMDEYEKMLEDEAEAAKAKRLEAAIAMNSAFKQSDFGGAPQEMPSGMYDRPETYPAANQHPRIFLAGADISEIYDSFLNDPNMQAAREAILTYADSPDFTGIFQDKVGKSGEIYRYDTTILAQIEARAFMYLMTGEELYGYEAIVGAKNAILSLKYTTDLHMDVYHGASHVMVNVAKVYDWCYDLLSEDDKNQLIAGVSNILGPQMESGMRFPPSGMNGISGHGTGPQFIRDWMTVAIAFYDEMPSWWDFVGGRYYQDYVPVINEISVNGWASQGTVTYGDSKYFTRSWAAWLVKTTTGEFPYIDDFRNCAYYYFSHIQPNGKYFQTGDGTRSPDGCTIGDSCAYMLISAALFQDPTIGAMAKYYLDGYTRFSYSFTTEMTAPDVIIFYTLGPDVKEQATENIPLIQFFDAPAATLTARTDWTEDAAAVLMRIGTMTLSNHDLYDHGTFQIYYKGLLAATSGAYREYGADVHRYYLQATVAHNGLLVFDPDLGDVEPIYGTNADGSVNTSVITNKARYYYSGSQVSRPSPSSLDEWLSGGYEMGTLLGSASGMNPDGTPSYAYIGGDITSAYNADTVTYVGRKMLTVFTGDESVPMIFFTYDQMTSKEEDHIKYFLLHMVNEPTVNEADLTAEITEGEGRLVLHSLSGADAITAIGGPDKAYWINGKNCTDEETRPTDYETIWGRIELSATGTLATTMFTAMYVTDSTSEKTLEFNTKKTDVVQYTQVLDFVAVFTETTETGYYKEFSFTTEGRGLYKYFVSGVEMGTWRVKVDGVPVATVVSDEGGAFVSFVAPAGEVTLVPGADVVGGNGGRIKYSLGGGKIDGDYPLVYKNDVATPLPTNISKPESKFLGWYTTPTFDEGTEIAEIAIGTTGTVTVYAKWLNNLVNVNHATDKPVYATAGKPTVNGITYNVNDSMGGSFKTVDGEDRYLEWIKGSGNSFMTTSSKTTNYSTMQADDECASFTVVLSNNGTAETISSLFRIYTKTTMSGVTNDDGSTTTRQVIFSTNSNGEVRLGDSGAGPIAAILTEEKTTLRIVLDFKNEELRAYDDFGFVVARTPVSPKSASEATTMSEWRSLLTSVLFYWISNSGSEDSSIRVYSIKIDEGDRFKDLEPTDGAIIYNVGAGGMLPTDAPKFYSKETPTELPIPLASGSNIFAGWYTSPSFEPETAISSIPTDTEGVVTVYAKWLMVLLDEDYSDVTMNNTTGDASSKGVTYRINGSTGASFKTVKNPETGRIYLELKEGSASTNPYMHMNNGAIATLTENQISYEVSFSKNGDAPLPTFYLRTLAQYNTAGDKLGTSNSLYLFKVTDDGIYLSENGSGTVSEGDIKIGDITDGIMTVRIVIDFENLEILAYTDLGEVISRPFAIPESSGAKDGIEFKSTFTTYVLYLMTSTHSKISDAEMRFYGIKIKSGNMFTSNDALDGKISYVTGGGKLPADAPKEYLPDEATPLPTPTKANSVFVGWYTTSDFKAGTQITEIPAGTSGIVAVYAKWIESTFFENFKDLDIAVSESTTHNKNGVVYNAGSAGEPKPGSSLNTVTDDSGNKYLRVTAHEKNTCLAITSNTYNLTHFAETAISYQLDVRKESDLDMATLEFILTTSGAKYGRLRLYSIDSEGKLRLNGSDKVILTVGESFTTLRFTLDFEAATFTAYAENGEALDTIRLSVPEASNSVTQPATLADWQKVATNYVFYANIVKGSAEGLVGLGFDNITIYDGRAFGSKQAQIKPSSGIVYETLGGKLPADASTEFNADGETPLAIPTRDGHIFDGWYTDPEYAEGTRVSAAPAGAEGEFRVYAKWMKILAYEDYSETVVNVQSANKTVASVGYNAGNTTSDIKEGASFKSQKDDQGNGYLVWIKGEKDPIININNGTMAPTGSLLFSYEIVIARNGDAPLIATSARTMAQYDKDGNKLSSSAKLFLFGTENNGNVYLGSDKTVSLGTVPTDGSTFTVRVVIDFAALKVIGYLDDGTTVSVGFTIPAQTGAATGEEYAALFTTYLFYWQSNVSSDPTASMIVDSIKATEGNIFE